MKHSTLRGQIEATVKSWLKKHWRTSTYLLVGFWLMTVPLFFLMYVSFWIGRLTHKWTLARREIGIKAVPLSNVTTVKMQNTIKETLEKSEDEKVE